MLAATAFPQLLPHTASLSNFLSLSARFSFPASRRFHNRRPTLHFSQLDISGAGLPCGSHPAFRTSGPLTAEEWQDNFLRSNLFWLSPLPRAATPTLAHGCSPPWTAPPAPQMGCIRCGVERFARLSNVASLYSQLLSKRRLLATSHSRNSPLASRPSSTCL